MLQTRRFPLRAALALCMFMLLLCSVAAAVLWPADALPAAGWFKRALLPQFLTGAALLFAVFIAPLALPEKELSAVGWKAFAAKAALAGAWCGAGACFMLLASARVVPLESGAAAETALWIGAVATVSILLDAAVPHAAQALLFSWIVLPLVSAYMLLEVFLTSRAGAAGLAENGAPQALALRSTLHWILNLSPGTAAFGALSGTLADGSKYSHWAGVLAILLPGAAALFLMRRASLKARSAGIPPASL